MLATVDAVTSTVPSCPALRWSPLISTLDASRERYSPIPGSGRLAASSAASSQEQARLKQRHAVPQRTNLERVVRRQPDAYIRWGNAEVPAGVRVSARPRATRA